MKMEGGNPVNGRLTRGLIKPESEEDPASDSPAMEGGESDAKGFSDNRIILEFTEMPRTPLPPKDV